MSLDVLNGKIRVYNYSSSPVGFPSQQNPRGVYIDGHSEDEEFVVERVSFEDVEVENTKSDLFKVGRLRFHPDEENEVYSKLGIEDTENILSDKELYHFLMQDSIENIRKIIETKSLTLITRMKTVLFSIERTGKIPPHNISSAVMERSHELLSGGKRNPDSEINRILEADKKQKEDLNLRDTLNEMNEKISILETEKKSEAEANAKNANLLAQSQSAIELLLKQVEELTKKSVPETVSPSTVNNKKQEVAPKKNG